LFFKMFYYLSYITNWRENRAAACRRKQAMASTATNLKDYAVSHQI